MDRKEKMPDSCTYDFIFPLEEDLIENIFAGNSFSIVSTRTHLMSYILGLFEDSCIDIETDWERFCNRNLHLDGLRGTFPIAPHELHMKGRKHLGFLCLVYAWLYANAMAIAVLRENAINEILDTHVSKISAQIRHLEKNHPLMVYGLDMSTGNWDRIFKARDQGQELSRAYNFFSLLWFHCRAFIESKMKKLEIYCLEDVLKRFYIFCLKNPRNGFSKANLLNCIILTKPGYEHLLWDVIGRLNGYESQNTSGAKIGEGGQGSVHLMDKHPSFTYAIKKVDFFEQFEALKSQRIADYAQFTAVGIVNSIFRDLSMSAAVSHPNVLDVYDFWIEHPKATEIWPLLHYFLNLIEKKKKASSSWHILTDAKLTLSLEKYSVSTIFLTVFLSDNWKSFQNFLAELNHTLSTKLEHTIDMKELLNDENSLKFEMLRQYFFGDNPEKEKNKRVSKRLKMTLCFRMERCDCSLEDWIEGENAYLDMSKEMSNLDFQVKTVEEKLKKRHRENMKIFHQLVLGTDATHRAGLIHRDLKPSNILLKCLPEGLVLKIGDFGISTDLHDCRSFHRTEDENFSLIPVNDHSLTNVGDRDFIAPEVSFGLPYSHKADMYSIGKVLKALYGQNYCWFPKIEDTIMNLLAFSPDERFSTEELLTGECGKPIKPKNSVLEVVKVTN